MPGSATNTPGAAQRLEVAMHDECILIPLSRGKFAKVDPEDAERVLAMAPWQCTKTGYAIKILWKSRTLLHRFLMDAPDDMQVDHINGDKLDCRKANLRLATDLQNRHNTPPHRDCVSGFKGVSFNGKRWRARIYAQGKQRALGYFDTLEEAARVYDAAAKELYGEFAWLNFPDHENPA